MMTRLRRLRRGILIIVGLALWSGYAVMIPVHAAQPDFEILAIRFFETGVDLKPEADRKYINRFPRETARFIATAVTIQNKQPGLPEARTQIRFQYLDPDHNVLTEQTGALHFNPGEATATLIGFGGWNYPGKWPVGTQTVTIWINDQLSRTSEFEIYRYTDTITQFIQLREPPAPNAQTITAADIQITAKAGVSDALKASAQRGITDTLRFYKENYQVELRGKIRVVLVPDKDAYYQVMVQDEKMDTKTADYFIKFSTGFSGKELILINTGKLDSVEMIFMIGHELTHHFQSQQAPRRMTEVMWLTEGSADAVGAYIALGGESRLPQVSKAWQKIIEQAAGYPNLTNIHTEKDWISSIESYGSEATYRVAGLAALKLADRKGFLALFRYFINLKSTTAEDAFLTTFGTTCYRFETEFTIATYFGGPSQWVA